MTDRPRGVAATSTLDDAIAGCAAQVHLLSFDVATFDTDLFRTLAIPCPPAIARSVRKRQAEFLHGRLAARAALRAAGATSTTVDSGSSREPRWPAGFIGSITHCRELAAAVALPRASWLGVGIDIEAVVAPDMRAALVPAVLTRAEFDYLTTLESATLSIEALMTIVFSAKESLFKAGFASVGRYFDFAAARVVRVDVESGELVLELTENLAARMTAGLAFRSRFRMLREDLVLTSVLL